MRTAATAAAAAVVAVAVAAVAAGFQGARVVRQMGNPQAGNAQGKGLLRRDLASHHRKTAMRTNQGVIPKQGWPRIQQRMGPANPGVSPKQGWDESESGVMPPAQ